MAKRIRRILLYLFLAVCILLSAFWGFIFWIPGDQAYQALNQFLFAKTGLHFRYERFERSLGQIRFAGVQVFSEEGVLAEALSLGWGFHVSWKEGVHFDNLFKVKSLRADWKKLSQVFRDHAKQIEPPSAAGDHFLKRLLARTEYFLSVENAEILISGKPLRLEGYAASWGATGWEIEWGPIKLRAEGEVYPDLNVEGVYRLGNEALKAIGFSGKLVARLPDLTAEPLRLEPVWGEDIRKRFEILKKPMSLNGTFTVEKTIVGRFRANSDSIFQGAIFLDSDRALTDPRITISEGMVRQLVIDAPFAAQANELTLEGFVLKSGVTMNGSLRDLKVSHPRLREPIVAPLLRFNYESSGKSISFESGEIGLENGKYRLSGDWRPADKNIHFSLSGNLFDKKWLSENPSERGGGGSSEGLTIQGHVDIGRVNWGPIGLDEVVADLDFHSPKWEWNRASFAYLGQKIGLSGAYDSDEKRMAGTFAAESFDLKILEPYLAEPNQIASVSGKISAQGPYEWTPNGYLVGADFESLGTVSLANTSYQKKIWKLPFISSKKSTEDLFQSLSGGVRYQGSDKGNQLELKEIRFLSEEFAFRLGGRMAPGKPDWKFDLDFLFSDYFMNQHIIWNDGLRRFARMASPEDPMRATNQSLTHILGVALEKKSGEFSYVLK